ncbi:MAG TPA: VanZ family protein, partial [Terriglobales bacterium]|nr:VanZ family protein [Terriglobales bacterium]
MLKRWLPVIIWMSVIFSASSDSASFQHSSRFLDPLVRWLFPSWAPPRVDAAVFFLRKCAHFTEFGILVLLVWRALQSARLWRAGEVKSLSAEDTAHSQGSPGCSSWRWKPAFIAFGVVVVYAITDEFHQYFVPTRQASA